MSFPEVEPAYRTDYEPTDLATVCWLAQEVLTGYQLFDLKPVLIDSELEEIAEKAADGDQIAYEEHEGDDEPEIIDYNYIDHSRTKCLDIGESTCAQLDNLPLILDDYNVLHQLTEPGFVSMRITEFDDLPYTDTRTTEFNNPATSQLIFRLPWHNDGSAIFMGYSIAESERIDDNPSKVAASRRLLKCMRAIYRADMMDVTSPRSVDVDGLHTDLDMLNQYAVLSLPIRPMGTTAMLFMNSQKSN